VLNTMLPETATNTLCLSPLLKNKYRFWLKSFLDLLSDLKIRVEWLEGTKDVWARDYSPVQIDLNRFVQFRYEPDYLVGHDDVKTPPEPFKQIFKNRLTESNLVVDGGNLVYSENKVILTDKIFSENPGKPPQEIRRQLSRLLDADIIVIPREPYDPIGHSDGICRFTVLVNDYTKVHPSYHERLLRNLSWHRIKWEFIPYNPVHTTSRGGIPSAEGNYVNYLQVGRSVVVPTYKNRLDDQALKIIEKTHPNHSICPFESSLLAKDGGVLNCISWPLKKENHEGNSVRQ
jgi:agmatine deiminase